MKVKTEYQSVQIPKELIDAIRVFLPQCPELGYRSYHDVWRTIPRPWRNTKANVLSTSPTLDSYLKT